MTKNTRFITFYFIGFKGKSVKDYSQGVTSTHADAFEFEVDHEKRKKCYILIYLTIF